MRAGAILGHRAQPFVCVRHERLPRLYAGHRIMLPTAISQLIEQVGKVGVALPMAIWGMRAGGPALGAAGALLGTSIAEGAALLYMAVKHLLSRRAFAQVAQDESAAVLSRSASPSAWLPSPSPSLLARASCPWQGGSTALC